MLPSLRPFWPYRQGPKRKVASKPSIGIVPRSFLAYCGGMAEWLKALAWNACRLVRVSWVRIPLPPPNCLRQTALRQTACRQRGTSATSAPPHLLSRYRAGLPVSCRLPFEGNPQAPQALNIQNSTINCTAWLHTSEENYAQALHRTRQQRSSL